MRADRYSMLQHVAASIVASAPAASSSPPPENFRHYDFARGEQAPPSGRLFARTIQPEAWENMSQTDRVRNLEVEGFCVVPQMLDAALVKRLQAETGQLSHSNSPDYSSASTGAGELAAALVDGNLGPELTAVPAHPPTVAFLNQVFGQPPLFLAMDYTRTVRGFPGISLHCDGQPWGIAEQFGAEFAVPKFLKCLYALDDTTEDISAFKVVPRSHLSFHADANPYMRYDEHPEAVKLCMKKGDACFFSSGLFHGNFPHTGPPSAQRRVLAVSYRADWAGPHTAGAVPTWSDAKVARLPPSVRAVVRDRNTRVWWPVMPNKSPDYIRPAPGISPLRHGSSYTMAAVGSDSGGQGNEAGATVEWTMQTEKDLLRISRSRQSEKGTRSSTQLPRVLLVGDSISIGYTDSVRQQLQGVADVYRPDVNCGHTAFGVQEMEGWLQQTERAGCSLPSWDCVHMNFGIHDIKCPNRDGKNNTPLDEYKANLDEIIRIVRAAGVRHVIWCSTTLSPLEVCGAPSEDFVRYNQAAREVARAANAVVNDLYSFSLPRLADIQIPRNSHFTPRGSAVLAGQVAAAIRATLFS